MKKKSIVNLPFEADVKAVRMRRDRIIVVLQGSIRVYNFTQCPRELRKIDTGLNSKGIVRL